MVTKITKEDAISSLKKLNELSGGKCTKANYIKFKLKPSHPTILNLFGSWESALKEAGVQGSSIYMYTDEEMLQSLKDCYAENDNKISHKIYRSSKRKPSLTAIEARFGSYKSALEKAGIEPNKVVDTKFTDEELLQALVDFADEHDGFITFNAYEELKKGPSGSVIRKRFKTWNKALEAAGIPLNQKKEAKFTEDEMLSSLQRISELLPHVVSRGLYKKYRLEDEPSVISIERHFKTWNKALEAAELETIPKYTKESILKSIEDFYECYGEESSNDLYRKVEWSPGLTTITRHFGSWEKAIEEINQNLKFSQYTRDMAIEEMRACAAINPKPLVFKRYIEEGRRPSFSWIKKNFGSWTDAKKIAEIE